MLTPDQEQRVRDHLHCVGARETCVICDAGRWTVEPRSEVDLLARICAQCGHTLLFDPQAFGLAFCSRVERREGGRLRCFFAERQPVASRS